MYKLLVVDDEPRQAMALANIISQLRPDYEILTAYDGQEALDLLSEHNVNILFTDIRMPVMDGLQLIEKLYRCKIFLKIIILSGYGEFEYAKKAIQFGVNEYLVKPISKNDLENILVKMESSLEEERLAKLYEEELKKKLDYSLPIYLDHRLNRWVAGKSSEEELTEVKSIFPYQNYGLVFLTSLKKLENLSENSDTEFVQYAKFSIKEALNTFGHSISFLKEYDKCQIVTVLVSKNPLNCRSNDLLKKLEGYIEKIRDKYSIIATVGVSISSDDIFEDIVRIFKSAQAAIERKFFTGLGKVIFSTNCSSAATSLPYVLGPIENEISEAVHVKDKISISRIISDTFENIKKCYINPKQLKEDFALIMLNQAKNVSRLIDSNEYIALVAEIKRKPLQCEEYSELWHFTSETLCRIIDITDDKFNDKNGILINKCKKFIDENYMEDVSLETVAQKYYFNSSYFSNLFKSYMGFGFSEYLLKVRIQNAKKLLKDTGNSMADVACRVGFKDPSYFNRVFKKEEGISPLKYRQMNENR